MSDDPRKALSRLSRQGSEDQGRSHPEESDSETVDLDQPGPGSVSQPPQATQHSRNPVRRNRLKTPQSRKFFRRTAHDNPANILLLDNNLENGNSTGPFDISTMRNIQKRNINSVYCNRGLTIYQQFDANENMTYIQFSNPSVEQTGKKSENNSYTKLMYKKKIIGRFSFWKSCLKFRRSERWLYLSPYNGSIFYKDLSDKNMTYILKRIVRESAKASLKSDQYINSNLQRIHTKFTKILTKIKKPHQKQHAYAALEKANGSLIKIKLCLPKGEIHSEDRILKNFFKRLNKLTESKSKVKTLWIYSYYCPCLGRKQHVPCMIRLISISKHLYKKYEIKTIIGFSKPYICTNNFTTKNIQCVSIDTMKSRLLPENLHQSEFTFKGTKSFHFLHTIIHKIQSNNEKSIGEMKNNNNNYKNIKNKNKNNKNDRSSVGKIIDVFEVSVDSQNGNYEYHVEQGHRFCDHYENELRLLLEENNESVSDEVFKLFRREFEDWWKNNLEKSYNSFVEEKLCEAIQMEAIRMFVDDVSQSVNAEFLPRIVLFDPPESSPSAP